MGIAVRLGNRCSLCGRMYSHPKNGYISLTVKDVNIVPLQQHDKEPATRNQQEEPNKTTISIPNTFLISAYF